ncbi:hypothetical protein LTR10_014101 [Elasticomyces elasticus]|uniref:DUF453-domain-containing protein n=1 Tax=Exophiala sideris TaxID=1016849 RepID=A0ABR0J3E2_9EURO|nr:hypothetical protein LTR10_014101 [Elasticomyces elasticus]KAK5026507.1 hypothetical protein LTS07_007441 [Exophiala sideris]KAK5033752.1 hypothetical protein LTR13_006804 [Exophiala sideris]KAK5055574.1 hypothetical protein LTR69_008407 [Exophiala sideris]KAK5180042.1 hypothetical protein LTR44_007518 [Eurotiomycetes sp. CCFEE 6388]
MLLGHRWANTTTLGHIQRSVRACLDLLWINEDMQWRKPMSTAPSRFAVKASFWRGGTSKGVFFNIDDLPEWFKTILNSEKPPDKSQFQQMEGFFAAVMGSPDSYGRQLNGMGGGISSLSKAMVVGPSSLSDVDVDYTFFQIGVKDGKLDMAGNCGNLSSAVGPYALNSGIYRGAPHTEQANNNIETGSVTMKMRNINTKKIIESTFDACKINGFWQYVELGKSSIDGVPGTGSSITLSFLDPEGSKTPKARPTGNAVDHIKVGDQIIRASLIDISNPGIFIDGRDVGWHAGTTPEAMNADAQLLGRLEAIRREGTKMMGLDPNVSSIPKIVLLFPAKADGLDISCQALSMEQAHKAVPVTLALNLGAACKMEGTIPNQLSNHLHHANTTIGHPSGTLVVGADMKDGRIRSAKLLRTARCHMDGMVNITKADEDEAQFQGS